MEINFITSNSGKVQALVQALNRKGYGDIAVKAQNLKIMEPQADTVAEVSLYKAQEAYKILKKPVLVEDGGLSIAALNGFPGVYTHYVISVLGADGIMKLLAGVENRTAKFISVATFIDENGEAHQFERKGGEFEIARERRLINHPAAWSEVWQIMFVPEYGKALCEFTPEELAEYMNRASALGSLQNFACWLIEHYMA